MLTKRVFLLSLLILGLAMATYNLSSLSPTAEASMDWRGWKRLSFESRAKPDMSVHNGRLYATTKGSDGRFYYNSMDSNNRWGSWDVLPQPNYEAVEIASYKDLVFLAHSKDNRMSYGLLQSGRRLPSNFWQKSSARPTSVPVGITYGNRFYIFFRGVYNNLYMASARDYREFSFNNAIEIPGNMKTTVAPEVAVHNNSIYLIVRSTNNRIFINRFDDRWSGWQEIPGKGQTPSIPAIASAFGNLYVMHRGLDNNIYIAKNSRGSWSRWEQINGQTSSSPSLAEFNGRLYAMVRGLDNQLYMNYISSDRDDWRLDKDRDSDRDRDRDRDTDRDRDRDRDRDDRGGSNRREDRLDARVVDFSIPDSVSTGETFNIRITIRNTGDTTWTRRDEIKLGAVGDSDPFTNHRILLNNDDAIRPNQTKTFVITMKAPQNPGSYVTDWQMVQENVRWFGEVVAKTIEVRRSSRDRDRDRDRDRGRDRDDRDANRWYQIPGNGRTPSGPASAVFNDQLYLLVRGTDNGIYINTYGNRSWGNSWQNIDGATPSQGALVTYRNNLYAIVRGTDNQIYINQNRGNGFTRWQTIPGGGATSSGPAAAVYNGRLYVIVRGTDDSIYANSMNSNGSWSGWSNIGGKTPSEPAVGIYNGQLIVFVRGTDNNLWMNSLGRNWSGWQQVPGNGKTHSGPGVTVHNDRLILFVQGTNDRIYQNTLSGNNWRGWAEVPGDGRTPSGPAAVSYQNNLYLFVQGTDNAIYENRIN